MKTLSPELLEHRSQDVTTLTRCWKCTRVDGLIFGFTSLDEDIDFEGVIYSAATGMIPSSIESSLDLSVPNLDVVGFLDSTSITEIDLLGGKWDNCVVEIFEVNYTDLTQGRMILITGTIGGVTSGRLAFSAELRGLSQALQNPIGSFYTLTCQANFGDVRCAFDAEALRVNSSVSTVLSKSSFTAGLAGVDDFYGAGLILWTSGLNDAIEIEVSSFVEGAFKLSLSLPFNITIGDTFSVIPGCRRKRTEDCLNKWNNVINFRGFPDVPLNDKVLQIASQN